MFVSMLVAPMSLLGYNILSPSSSTLGDSSSGLMVLTGLVDGGWRSVTESKKRAGVTVCLLTHGIFLLSFFHRTHILFGICSYDWVHCLILLSSFNSFHWTLTLCRSSSITTGQGYTLLLISAYHFDSYLWTVSSSNQFYRIGYIFLLTTFILSCSMMFYAYVSHSIQ